MQQDAARALQELEPRSPFRPVAVGLHAIALWLRGDDVRAGAELARAAAVADAAGATLIRVMVEAVRALLALGRGDVAGARSVIDGVGPAVSGRAFVDCTPMAMLHAADAQTATQEGDRELARRRLAAVQRLWPYMTGGMPVFGVLVLVEAASAYHALGNTSAAKALLVDADDLLARAPQLGILVDRVFALRDRIAVADRGDERWASTLTAAELRLLPLLTTHLTFREIGDRLFVSRNTVKTQAISIYRKLGAGTRAEAVQRATELGLLEPNLAQSTLSRVATATPRR
jgi:LuxR family maltose regulon positive regulatory protein